MAALVLLLAACGNSTDRRDSFYEKGKQALAAGNAQDAQIALKNAIKIDPQFAKGYTLLGAVQIQDRNFANAYASYARAVELDPNEMDAQLGLCKLFYLQRSMDKVEEKADLILAKLPDHVEAGVIKAIVLSKQGRTDEALARLTALQAKHPENVDIILAKSETYTLRNESPEAERTLLEGLSKNPKSLLLHMHTARFYAQHNDLDSAERHFLEVVAIEPENPGANMLLVNFYTQTGQAQKAMDALNSLVKRFPQEEQYRLALVNAIAKKGTAADIEEALVSASRDLPGSNQIKLALAEHYSRTMQVGKAEALLKEFIAKDPDLPQAVRARRILAGAYLASQQVDKAQTELDAVLKRNPRDTEGHLLMGSLDLQKGKVREAILELRQVVDADPKSVRAYEMLVRSHLLNNEGLQAEALLAKTIKENPDSMQTRMLLVETLASTGKTDRALVELNAMAAKDPTNPAIFVTTGDIQAQKKNLSAAKAAYKRAMEIAPKEPLPLVRLGRVLMAQQDFRGAHDAFDKALALSPDAREAAELKVALYFQDKRPDEALKFTRQRVLAQPKDAFNNLLLGRVLMETKDSAGAEQYFNQAILLAPEAPSPYQYLGQLKIQQGKVQEGIQKYRDAYAANPGAPSVGLALGMLLQAQKNAEEAKSVYEQLLQKNPNYLPVLNNLAYLYAQDLPTPENLKKAQGLIERLKGVDNGGSLDTIGWVHFKTGNKDEALAQTLRAWEKMKDAPTVAYHLAVIYNAKGEKTQALKWYEKALVLPGAFPERESAKLELAELRRK
ncbi:MAG TPA: tetratricopeptide repeat protein [Humidesulfovibrio sp.]|uniref:tetratricopeptide repeat protein n=1 Tax=Humidesulfovibrio sp. TaxID=2910988 RepID=UPI002C9F0C82|nr:tetratricopeptide repeat protein [Humidesulfovibrio sp.]HWR04300.1 tetratricopeptide repeat protein [Humidesulfovibrio sp.]